MAGPITCPRCGGEYYPSNDSEHNGIHGNRRSSRRFTPQPVHPEFNPDLRDQSGVPTFPRPEADNGCPVEWCGTTLKHHHDSEGYVRYEPPR